MKWLRGTRTTATTAVSLAGVLAVAAVVFGVGVSSAHPDLADIGAWLANARKGTVVHANGIAGQVDGLAKIPGARRGDSLRIVQDGGTVLIIDERTGVVSRIDPSQLTVVQSSQLAVGTQLVVGAGAAYAIDPALGTVQRIDPFTLASIGQALTLRAPLERAAVDGRATLWVPEPMTGNVIPINQGVQATPVKVGDPGNPLALTMAQGQGVIVNSAQGAAMVVETTGVKLRVNLPQAVRQAGLGGVLTPILTEGPLVPMLNRQSGELVILDVGTGSVGGVTIPPPSGQFGAPQALGRRVYVPDERRGVLIVFDAAANRFLSLIKVSGRQGPLDVFVKDGLLWANDQGSASAVVVDPEGKPHPVDKYEPDVPGQVTPKPDPARPTGPPGKATPGKPEPPPPKPPAPPKPDEPPVPPGPPSTVNATSNPGYIVVKFAPSEGGVEPTGYVLKDPPPGAQVTPEEVDAGGPHEFRVDGLDCAQQYSFTVAAKWAQGEVVSAPSMAVRPCVAPGAPQNFRVSGTRNHGATLAWEPPGNAGAAPITYVLGGPGGGDVTGTSRDVGGLRNYDTYNWTLRAKNPAGESAGSAQTSVTLEAPAQGFNLRNVDYDVPIKEGSTTIGYLKKGSTDAVTLYCAKSGRTTTSRDGRKSSAWNVGQWNGRLIWYSNLYVSVPTHGTSNLAVPPLWDCDDKYGGAG